MSSTELAGGAGGALEGRAAEVAAKLDRVAG